MAGKSLCDLYLSVSHTDFHSVFLVHELSFATAGKHSKALFFLDVFLSHHLTSTC